MTENQIQFLCGCCATILAKSFVSAGNTNFEWAIVGVCDNSATAGENVGGYFQGIKRATGPTWGAVAEVIDKTGANPTTGAVGIEVNVTANGTDTSNNRVGIDVAIRKDDAGTIATEVVVSDTTWAVRINGTAYKILLKA